MPSDKISLTGICLAVMLLCGLAVGILPKTFLGLVVLLCSVLLVITQKIWMAFPIMIFYYESFGLLFGMSVYRYFSLLFLFFILLTMRSLPIRYRNVAPFLIFVIYCAAVIAPINARRAIFAVVDVACILLLIHYFLETEKNLKAFFRVYVITALCAFVTGIVLQRSFSTSQILGGELVDVVRNYATFEDPNYAGLFYSVGLFAMMSLSLFHPVVRAVIAVAMSAMILTTLSITALILNVIFWIVYLFAFRKINLITAACFLLVIAALLGLYVYGVENPQTPVVGSLALRIQDKLIHLSEGDINDVTTNRTGLAARHWKYFCEQSFFRMLVGMNAASTLYTNLGGYRGVAHNEYVDLLLNVGILGALVYLGIALSRTFHMFYLVRKNGDAYSGCIFMLKVIWLAYGFALTLFGDHRFMMLFFL